MEQENPLPRAQAPAPPGSTRSSWERHQPPPRPWPRSHLCPCLGPRCVRGVKMGARPAMCPRSLRNEGCMQPPSSHSQSKSDTTGAETPTEITKKSMLAGFFPLIDKDQKRQRLRRQLSTAWQRRWLCSTLYFSAQFTRSLLSDLQLGISTSHPGCFLIIQYLCKEQLSFPEQVCP